MLATVFFFEVPSGFIADRCGNKKTVIASKFSVIISLLLFIITPNFLGFIVANALLGLAGALESGAKNSYYIEVTRKENIDYSDILVQKNKYSKFVQFFLMISSSMLYMKSYTLPFTITIILYVFSIIFLFLLPNDESHLQGDKKEKILVLSKKLLTKIVCDQRLRLELIFYTFTSAILISNFDYYTHYFIEANINIEHLGFIFASFMLINVIGISIYSKGINLKYENLLFLITPFSFLLISFGNIVALIIGILIQQILFAYYSIHFDIYVIRTIDDLKQSSHYQSMISFIYTILRMCIVLLISFGLKILNLSSMFFIFFLVFLLITVYYIINRNSRHNRTKIVL